MDFPAPNEACNIIFWESKLEGCLNADKPFCKQAVTALFVESPITNKAVTGCDEICQNINAIQQGVRDLYGINLANMGLKNENSFSSINAFLTF